MDHLHVHKSQCKHTLGYGLSKEKGRNHTVVRERSSLGRFSVGSCCEGTKTGAKVIACVNRSMGSLLEGINTYNIHGFTGMCLNLDCTKKLDSNGAQRENTQLTSLPQTPFEDDRIPEHINM